MSHIEMNNHALSLSLANMKSDAAQQNGTFSACHQHLRHTHCFLGDSSQGTATSSQPKAAVAQLPLNETSVPAAFGSLQIPGMSLPILVWEKVFCTRISPNTGKFKDDWDNAKQPSTS